MTNYYDELDDFGTRADYEAARCEAYHPDIVGAHLSDLDFERHALTLHPSLCPGSDWTGTSISDNMIRCCSCDCRAVRSADHDRMTRHNPVYETPLPGISPDEPF